jgi:hypothetical protein
LVSPQKYARQFRNDDAVFILGSMAAVCGGLGV